MTETERFIEHLRAQDSTHAQAIADLIEHLDGCTDTHVNLVRVLSLILVAHTDKVLVELSPTG